jgi:hypothetical protein
MLIARIEGCDLMIGAPRDWDEARDGLCGVLPVRREVHGGLPAFASAWEPTPEELAALNAGGKIILTVLGQLQHPVVSIGVSAPPE